MTFVQDNKSSGSLTQTNRTAVASLTQNNKSSTSLSQTSRTTAATLTQNNKTTSGYLWSATIFPWQMQTPWLWVGNGQILTLDARH